MRNTAVLAAALVVSAAALHAPASTTVYTDESAFKAALLPGYYLEDFEGFALGTLADPTTAGPVNGYEYLVSTPALSTFPYVVWTGYPTKDTRAMSTTDAYDTLTFTFTGLSVRAVGGWFFATDYDGALREANITIRLDNGVSEVFFSSPLDPSTKFRGFMSDDPISVIYVTAAQPSSGYAWPTVDNLYVGNAVPEPVTLVSTLVGFGALGSYLRQRRGAPFRRG